MRKSVAGDQRLVQVVDDDPRIVRFVHRILDEADFRVTVAPDGRTALEEFEARSPDIVLLGIGVPQVCGLEVCRRMRASSDVPVIIMSATVREESVVLRNIYSDAEKMVLVGDAMAPRTIYDAILEGTRAGRQV